MGYRLWRIAQRWCIGSAGGLVNHLRGSAGSAGLAHVASSRLDELLVVIALEDISDLVGHSGTTVTETVYRHEIRPALTTGATAMDKILTRKRTPARLPTGEPATARLPAIQPSAAQPATRRATAAKPRARRHA